MQISSNKKILWLGAGLIFTVAIFLFVVTRSTPAVINTTPTRDVPISTFIPTPLEYQSFYGTIDSVTDNTVVVHHLVLQNNGDREELTQTATITSKTVLQSRQPDGTAFRFRPITAKDLHAGNAVIVAADVNLAGLTTFSATHIQRIDQ